MSGTNQYITMIASISVAIQFIYIGEMNFEYAVLFEVLTLFSGYTGITAVNIYVKRSGKQTLIPIIFVIVLTLALISLPIDYLMKTNAAKN